MKAENVLIRGGRIIDPASRTDATGDLAIKGGTIAKASEAKGATVIEAGGMIVCPGFIDLHCHLREPGFEQKETIATGTRAAAKGGFTTVCCMANTNPATDTRAHVDFIRNRAAAEGVVRVIPIGSITRGRKGAELAEMGEMATAGVAGFSDDGDSVPGPRLLRHAMEYSRNFGLPIMEHCEDRDLAKDGVINEGPVAARLGLRGIPAAAEEVVVARDLALAELTGAWLHVAHVSTAGSVDLIRRAKARGVNITCEVTPHHLTLTEERVMGAKWGPGAIHTFGPTALPVDAYDTYAKVNPPLRTEADRRALVQALKDGTIDAIATDHAPHAWTDKQCEFGAAAFGASNIETALAALLGLVQRGEIDLPLLIAKLTAGPASILNASHPGLGTLAAGSAADVAVIDPEADWQVREEDLVSRGKNNPYIGATLRGRVVATFAGGKIAYRHPSLAMKGSA